jgi:mRNA interferase RelE/StbE
MTFVNHLRGYQYIYTSSAKKDLKKINKHDVKKIDSKLKSLVSGNQDLDVKKLVDMRYSRFRLRVGDYRVIYEVYDNKILVLVVGVGHRKDVYRS